MMEWQTQSLRISNTGTYLGYEEVLGVKVKIPDIIGLLSDLDLAGILQQIALVNNSLNGASHSTALMRTLQEFLVANAMPPKLAEAVQNTVPWKEEGAVVFHGKQQLMLLGFAFLACKNNMGTSWTKADVHKYSEACLMLNDFTGLSESESRMPGSDKESIELFLYCIAAEMLTTVELISDNEHLGLIGRASKIWLELFGQNVVLKPKDAVPVAQRFLDRYGISLSDFLTAAYYVVMKVDGFDPNKPECLDSLIINLEDHVSQTKFSHATFMKAIELISITTDEMVHDLCFKPRQSWRHDFTVFRERPLIRIKPDICMCFDQTLLRKVFTDGVYWLIFDSLDSIEQKKFEASFGLVFEAYVRSLIGKMYPETRQGTPHMFFSPKFDDNSEVCDLLSSSENTWTIVEIKSSLLTTRAKYSGDVGALRAELQSKFCSDKSGDRRKGVTQLANSIVKLLNGKNINHLGVNTVDCSVIYPAILVYDSCVSGYVLPEIMQQVLIDSLNGIETSVKIKPLTVITVADLELLATIPSVPPINQIIATYQHNRNNAESFSFFLRRHYHGKYKPESSEIWEAYKVIANTAVSWFPDPN
jgi:hypothetical protein